MLLPQPHAMAGVTEGRHDSSHVCRSFTFGPGSDCGGRWTSCIHPPLHWNKGAKLHSKRPTQYRSSEGRSVRDVRGTSSDAERLYGPLLQLTKCRVNRGSGTELHIFRLTLIARSRIPPDSLVDLLRGYASDCGRRFESVVRFRILRLCTRESESTKFLGQGKLLFEIGSSRERHDSYLAIRLSVPQPLADHPLRHTSSSGRWCLGSRSLCRPENSVT